MVSQVQILGLASEVWSHQWNSLFTLAIVWSYTINYKASLLQAQGFGLVMPDPFSLRELVESGHETITQCIVSFAVHSCSMLAWLWVSCYFILVYSGTFLKGHSELKILRLIRTLNPVPTSYKYIIFSPWNKDTSLIKTNIWYQWCP